MMPPQRNTTIKGICVIGGLFLCGIVATYIMESTGADLAWTSTQYIEGGGRGGWIYSAKPLWKLLYDYGELPAWVLAIGAAAALFFVQKRRLPKSYARPCVAVVLAIALGPGLAVNGILKNEWGRPRPVDCTVFGGNEQFRHISEPAGPGGGKSFPCGHCSMAFGMAAGAVFYQIYPVASVCSLVGGIVFGIVMGFARVSQGGHFPSDVLWSGVIVLSLIAALYYLVLRIPDQDP
jgi:membrane-associated PAP2 superfamily phosphatase